MAKAQAQQKDQSPNFGSILDAAPSEVERPKPLPAGSYTCVIKGLPRYDKSSKKGTPFVEFTLQPIEAGEDVDEDDLKAMGGFTNKTIRATYYLTEDAAYRLDEFHEHCGIELDDTTSRRERNEQTPGKQVLAYVKHTASNDGASIYAELAKTAAVE